MNLFPLDHERRLFLSPDIDDWQHIDEEGITVVIDLDGDLDPVSTHPNHILYIYFPIYDEDLPNLDKLHAIVDLGASLVERGHKVLSHCRMGFNRSALVAGLILVKLGMSGPDAMALMRSQRPGALFNDVFATYLGEQ